VGHALARSGELRLAAPPNRAPATELPAEAALLTRRN